MTINNCKNVKWLQRWWWWFMIRQESSARSHGVDGGRRIVRQNQEVQIFLRSRGSQIHSPSLSCNVFLTKIIIWIFKKIICNINYSCTTLYLCSPTNLHKNPVKTNLCKPHLSSTERQCWIQFSELDLFCESVLLTNAFNKQINKPHLTSGSYL